MSLEQSFQNGIRMQAQMTVLVFLILIMTRNVSVGATTACSDKCGNPHGTGTCESDGKCLCWYGWTGPNSGYVKSGSKKGMIKADHCQWACHWTHVTKNPECVDEDNGNCSGGGSESESDSDEGF